MSTTARPQPDPTPGLFELDPAHTAPAPRAPHALEAGHASAPAGGLPPALRAHLDAIGQLDPDGISRPIRISRCTDCRAEILRGLDGHVAAAIAICDNIEVDELGEALAIATGRRTWWVGRFANSKKQLRYEFERRWPENIKAGLTKPVFVEHRCGVPPPPTTRTRFHLPDHTTRYTDDPPF